MSSQHPPTNGGLSPAFHSGEFSSNSQNDASDPAVPTMAIDSNQFRERTLLPPPHLDGLSTYSNANVQVDEQLVEIADESDFDSSDDEQFLRAAKKAKRAVVSTSTMEPTGTNAGLLPTASRGSVEDESTRVASGVTRDRPKESGHNRLKQATNYAARTKVAALPDLVDSPADKTSKHDPDETALLERINNQIIDEEEKRLLARIESSIVVEENVNMTPAASVLEIATPASDFSLRRDVVHIEAKDRHKKRRRLFSPPTKNSTGSAVEDLVDWDARAIVKKKLPRMIGSSPRFELTNSIFFKQIIEPILAQDPLPRRRLTGKLVSIEHAPHSLCLELRGHPDLLQKAVDKTVMYIQSFQSLASDTPTTTGIGEKESAGKDSSQTHARAVTTPSQASIAFRHFREKFNAAVRIEYHGLLNLHTPFKFMWQAHKEELGPHCDSECKCPEHLAGLTKEVVKKHMKAQKKKDPTWDNPRGLRPGMTHVGFVNRFAPKFYPLLEAEFPNESPQLLLERLTLMFEKHKRESGFGLKCTNACSCGQGWDSVFKRGHLRTGEENESFRTTASRAKSADRVPGNTASTASLQVPRKRKVGDQDRIDSSGYSMIPRKKKPSADLGSSSVRAPTDKRAYYEVEYMPGESLGFHCITEMKDGQLVCMVDSVAPQKRDDRVQDGTVVSGAALGDSRESQPLVTHTDLKNLFSRAKKDSCKLRVRFINTYVTRRLLNNLLSRQDWSTSGKWHGTKEGWAGGAPNVRPKDRKAPPLRSNRNEERSIQQFPVHPPHALAQDSLRLPVHVRQENSRRLPPLGHFVWKSEMATVQHRIRMRPPSILKRPKFSQNASKNTANSSPPVGLVRSLIGEERLTKKKSVSFRRIREDPMYFNRTDEPYKLAYVTVDGLCPDAAKNADAVTQNQHVNEEEINALPSQVELFDAIRTKTFKDVLSLLQRGAPFEKPDEDGIYARDVAKSVEDSFVKDRTDPANAEKLKDVRRKSQVLRIYVNARYSIDSARFLKAWIQLDLTFDGLQNLRLTRLGEEHIASNRLQCRVTWYTPGAAEVLLTELPARIVEERVEWGSQAAFVTFNASLDGARSRRLVVALQKGSSTDATGPVSLGRLEIPLSRLSEQSHFNTSQVRTENFASTENLQSATLLMSVRKGHVDKEYRDRKKKQAAKKLRETVDWIRKFNDDLQEGVSGPPIACSGHIAPAQCGYMSLLHAAVYSSDVEQVKRLLRLGASPLALSEVGSAKKLASTMAERRATIPDSTANASEDRIAHAMKEDYASPSAAILHILTEASKQTDQGFDSSSDVAATPAIDGLTLTETLTDDSDLSDFPLEDHLEHVERLSGDADNSAVPVESHESAGFRIPRHAKPATTGDARYSNGVDTTLTKAGSSKKEMDSSINGNTANRSDAEPIHRPSTDDAGANLSRKSVPQGAAAEKSNPQNSHPRDMESVPLFWTKLAGQKVCGHFNTSAGCRYGLSCHNVHIKPSIGDSLHDASLTMGRTADKLDSDFIRSRDATDRHGDTCFTAAYVNKLDNVTYYAEGGKVIARNKHGVSWYRSREDAQAALYNVLVFWQHGLDKKRATTRRRGESETAAREPSASLTFFNLLRKANLGNLFTQVFHKRQFKSSFWKLRRASDEGDGRVAVTLSLPFPVAGIYVFHSWDVGGGVIRGGRGYYKDVRSAKASAFYYLLVKAKKDGLISKNMWTLRDGTPLKLSPAAKKH